MVCGNVCIWLLATWPDGKWSGWLLCCWCLKGIIISFALNIYAYLSVCGLITELSILFDPMLIYCQIALKNKFQWNFNKNINIFFECISKYWPLCLCFNMKPMLLLVTGGWGLGAFLRWWPPSVLWAGPLNDLFMATTGDVWIIPSFSIWDYVPHVEHVSCVITNCGQHQYVIPSPLSIAL